MSVVHFRSAGSPHTQLSLISPGTHIGGGVRGWVPALFLTSKVLTSLLTLMACLSTPTWTDMKSKHNTLFHLETCHRMCAQQGLSLRK